MKLKQTLTTDGTDVTLTISDPSGRKIHSVVWKGAGKYVRPTGGLQGYTNLLVPTEATIDFKTR